MENSKCVIAVSKFYGKEYVSFSTYEQLEKAYASLDEKNKALGTENNELEEENSKLKRELEKEKQAYIKMDANYLWIKPNQASIMQENTELKLEIQRLREKCGEVPKESCNNGSCDQKSEDGVNFESLVHELQDQHQQDCIRINDLTTTVSVLSGMYANLRKNVGMD